MLKINGFKLYGELKKKDDRVKVCFIMAFELYRDEFQRVFPSLQVSCFVSKPVKILEMVKIIRQELEYEVERKKKTISISITAMHSSGYQSILTYNQQIRSMGERKKGNEVAEESAFAYSEFVKGIDTWLHLLVMRDGSAKYLAELIKKKNSRNAGTNVEYYTKLAMTSEKEGSHANADHYGMLAKLHNKACKI
jgi:hypothetical protein